MVWGLYISNSSFVLDEWINEWMNVLATMSYLKEIDFNGSKKIQMDYETFFLIISVVPLLRK